MNTFSQKITQSVQYYTNPLLHFSTTTATANNDNAYFYWSSDDLYLMVQQGTTDNKLKFASMSPTDYTPSTWLEGNSSKVKITCGGPDPTVNSFQVVVGTNNPAMYSSDTTTLLNASANVQLKIANVIKLNQSLNDITFNNTTTETHQIAGVTKLLLQTESGNTKQAVVVSGGLKVDSLFMHTKQHVNGYAMTSISSVFGGGYPFERVYFHNYNGNCTFTLPNPTMGGSVFTVIFGYEYTNIISCSSYCIKAKTSWTPTNSYTLPTGQQTITFAPTELYYFEI